MCARGRGWRGKGYFPKQQNWHWILSSLQIRPQQSEVNIYRLRRPGLLNLKIKGHFRAMGSESGAYWNKMSPLSSSDLIISLFCLTKSSVLLKSLHLLSTSVFQERLYLFICCLKNILSPEMSKCKVMHIGTKLK